MSNTEHTSEVSVCFVGHKPRFKRFGAWEIRGRQIASTRRNWVARRVKQVRDEELETCEIFCFVKFPDARLLERVHAKGKLAVHDVVDWWRQPGDHRKVSNADQARELFSRRWRKLPPFHAHILACRAMYDDLAPLSPFPTVIYHHYWPNMKLEPFRTGQLRVGYEGKKSYLGDWFGVMTELCRKHGMEFVAERVRTGPVDIGFAARGGKAAGYLPDQYKSNVKLANCFGAGIPAIMQSVQAAYRETATSGVAWFETREDIDRALAALSDIETRRKMAEANRAAAKHFSLSAIADEYERFFVQLLSQQRHD